jgi:hypothetical protein
MSFYTKIKTEITNKQTVLLALKEMAKRGEISSFDTHIKSGDIKIDRSGDILNITQEKDGSLQIAGDSRVANTFTNRLKQFYAYEAIKENLPLDFEIAEEHELGGDITIVLRG